ncbi:hypothetical protein IP78_03365 [Brevundimonas sp. AAP58]|uniref:hypothetical protein n=1 Tax=Brevundimonas sp. AAP58 TaxID=1523422 RepID=UPI0006B94866|nr:hypothetical protein [Brevundimonas sp. AAP58]KPF82913.1 hypothetical protein IP78_03365 [Brevundimonas sp. AAP58]
MNDQPDLFGAPSSSSGSTGGGPPAYVVPYPIAVNTLTRTLDMLRAAERWPWDPDMKAARMERNVPRMLAVLPPEEAADWRARINAEAARLDAAAATAA